MEQHRPRSSMDAMVVLRDRLIAALQTNRDTHRETFLKAQESYRTAVIEELEKALEDARAKRPIRRAITLPQPEDHTADYDNALTMLDMCVDKEILVTAHEFQCYVMDNWGWKQAWLSNTASYVQPK